MILELANETRNIIDQRPNLRLLRDRSPQTALTPIRRKLRSDDVIIDTL